MISDSSSHFSVNLPTHEAWNYIALCIVKIVWHTSRFHTCTTVLKCSGEVPAKRHRFVVHSADLCGAHSLVETFRPMINWCQHNKEPDLLFSTRCKEFSDFLGVLSAKCPISCKTALPAENLLLWRSCVHSNCEQRQDQNCSHIFLNISRVWQ